MPETQGFSFRDYSLSPADLIPDDEYDDPPAMHWQEYCRVAGTVDRQHILACVLSDLDADDSPLYELIDDSLDHPHTPGETPRQSITVLAKVGQAVLNLIARAVDAQVQLRMAAEGPHD